MNISSVQSAATSYFTTDSRVKAKGIESKDAFRNHKPMPREIAEGKDHGAPKPAQQVNRFGGPLPGQQVITGAAPASSKGESGLSRAGNHRGPMPREIAAFAEAQISSFAKAEEEQVDFSA